jgi:hypothetical protein
VLEIATSLKRADGETLPIPRRTAAAQTQSEAALARKSAKPSTETRIAAQLETVAIHAADGTIFLYDIYVVEEGRRIWIGSRRTLAQCQDAFEAHCGFKSPR